MAKIGVNNQIETPTKIPCSFVIIDNQPHLTKRGVEYISKWVQTLYLVTTNPKHPAKEVAADNIVFIEKNNMNLVELFQSLKKIYNIDRITIQSGGSLNSELVRSGLIDRLSIVVAPCLIGGKSTPTLIDGEPLHDQNDLLKIKPLKLDSISILKDGYLHLRYDVINNDDSL